MAEGLQDKVALVTGGSSGIGRAASLAFAAQGARVIVADLAVAGGEETVRMIEAAGGSAAFIRADVSKAAEVQALVSHAVERYGRLDCAFNNAGTEGSRASTADYLEEDWDRVIGTNLKGVWLCMKYEIPVMLEQGGGAVVNTSSVYGMAGGRGVSAYVASKHGVAGLTKAAALEYAPLGIRINAVCPGAIRTPMLMRHLPDVETEQRLIAAVEPIGRMGSPEEVAAAVVWLCSDTASFVTGHTMAVDGGYLAQ
jgi:NAD(P)-dependent dehydrogenase (short-subunit alcohol dehydrogenase family)